MVDSVDVRGFLVEVGKMFSAKPGDRLLIVNGTCLGIYSPAKVVEHERSRAGRAVSIQPEGPKPAKAKPKRHQPKAERRISASVHPTRDAVVAALSAGKSMRVDEIRVRLTEELRGKHEWKLRDALLLLRRVGAVSVVGNRQNATYTLRAPRQEAA